MNFEIKKATRLPLMLAPIAILIGCANQSAKPTASEVAVEQFRIELLNVAKETQRNINNANKISFSKDPRSDWINYLEESDTINMTLSFSYLNDAWTGTFENLMREIEMRTGYKYIDLINDRKISDKVVTIHGDNTKAINALYTAYSRVSHERIDLVIRPHEKVILLRPECVDNYNCSGMHELTAP